MLCLSYAIIFLYNAGGLLIAAIAFLSVAVVILSMMIY